MLEKDTQYSAADFIELKAKVKAEMLRRCYTGSLAEYGGSEYDFVDAPSKGSQIRAEQANKIIVPINAVNDSGFVPQNAGEQAKAMKALAARVTSYASAPAEGTGHYCKASCSGLCHTACSTGCAGTCSEECGDSCTTSCTGDCSGGCSGSCSAGCTGGCYGICSDACVGACGNSCSTSGYQV